MFTSKVENANTNGRLLECMRLLVIIVWCSTDQTQRS